jgi:hypothetical protein
MFRLIESSSDQIQSVVLVHSASAYYGIYCLQNYIDVKDKKPIYLNEYIKFLYVTGFYIYFYTQELLYIYLNTLANK